MLNYQIIVDFGFDHVLTGETGAGKTLIIDSLGVICGGRFSKEMIRKGESHSYVEICMYEPQDINSGDGNMARKKYNYNFVRKPSEGGKEALYMAGASVFLFLLASVVSFAFRGNGGIFLGAAGLFSFLLSGYGFYVGMKSFKEEQVSHRMSVLGSITSGGMLVAWLALFLIGVR